MRLTRSLILAGLLGLVLGCASPEERAAQYLDKAQSLYDAGNFSKAKVEAQNALQIEPKNAPARYLLALLAEKDGEFKALHNHLLVTVDADPTHVPAHLKLANLYFFGNAVDRAEEEMVILRELAPDDPGVRVVEARLKARAGDAEGASALLREALAADPDHTEAMVLLAAGLAQAGQVDEGLEILDTAIARLAADGDKARPLREVRVLILGATGRYAAMEADFTQLMQDYPDQSNYQQELARMLAAQGREEDAEKVLRTVAEQNPGEANPRLAYVGFLAARRDLDVAEGALRAFIEEAPDNLALRLTLGELYENAARNDEARATYTELAERAPLSAEGLRARGRLALFAARDDDLAAARTQVEAILKDAPDNPQALLLRAGLQFNEGRFQEAIADLRVVLRQEEVNPQALLLLAQAYFRSGDKALTRDSYRRLLAVNPAHAEGLMEFAAVLAADKDYDEARSLLERRVAAAPQDVLASARLIELYLQLKQIDAAEKEARRLAALPNQEGLGDYQLGRVHQLRGNLKAAVAEWQKALVHRPADPQALDTVVSGLAAAGRAGEIGAFLAEHVKKYPQQTHARYLLAGHLARQGRADEARGLLEGVIAAQPDWAPAWAALARLAGEAPGPRIAVYRRALEAQPGHADLGLLLGTELERAAQYDEAIAVYEQAVAAQPRSEAVIQRLVMLLLDRRGDTAAVDRALQLAEPFNSVNKPALQDALGWAWYRKGDHNRAVGLLERAVSRAGDPLYRYHLGMTYLAMGNPVGARQQLTQALADDKADFSGVEEARKALASL